MYQKEYCYLQYVDLAHPSLNHWHLRLLIVLLSGNSSGLTWSLFLTARFFPYAHARVPRGCYYH